MFRSLVPITDGRRVSFISWEEGSLLEYLKILNPVKKACSHLAAFRKFGMPIPKPFSKYLKYLYRVVKGQARSLDYSC